MRNLDQRPFLPSKHMELFAERMVDSYKLPAKLREPTSCPRCGAVYHKGRWQWLACPEGAASVVCAACQRISDNLPAGYLHIEKKFANAHKKEMLRLLHHHENHTKSEHPMERIIAIEESDERTVITTTGVHLARSLATAFKEAFHGTLQLNYSIGENLLRAYLR